MVVDHQRKMTDTSPSHQTPPSLPFASSAVLAARASSPQERSKRATPIENYRKYGRHGKVREAARWAWKCVVLSAPWC
jgi:hypothetical protein